MLKVANSVINVSQITGVLPVVNGGTGVTTSTGTGSTVLSAAPTLSGNVTLSTGNLVVADTKGIDFSATSHPAGMTSELLDDYEEGTWTPTDASAAALSLTTSDARYTKIGNMVYCSATITYPSTASALGAKIQGLPFTAVASSVYGGYIRYTDSGLQLSIAVTANSGEFEFYTAAGAAQTNVNLSTKRLDVNLVYQT